ncbi:PorT family protein [Rhodocytophaga rosea]|uniref:PorT family protein n=1 Tax=Rhodocytophaga rosea TaxID=2704465 RepID=A0A6C0GCS3_9BACT|nr:porin family protein [Rhodocytophaga rosea]QHT65613.1 PorT family protein [Rhodocytophaga rosea]
MRFIVLLGFFLIPLSFLNAQTSIGIKAGLNIPKVVFEPSIEQETIFTYNGGLIFKHFEDKIAGVQLEVNFSQKGWKEIIDSVQYYSRKINYIEIPCMSQFYLGVTKFRLFLNMGFLVGYSVSASEKIQTTDLQTNRKYSFTDTDNRAEFGLTGGLGMMYESTIGNFQLEGRFSQSMTDIQATTNSKNQVISVSIAYLISL